MSRSESMRSLVAGGEGRSRAGLHLRARREPRDQTLDRLAVPSPVLARPPGRLNAPSVQLRRDGGHRHALVGELLNERSQVLGERLRQAKAWLVSLACRKAKDLGYPHEKEKPTDAVAIISYDEKPGIQAIATTAPDLPPKPGLHATFARDHEYKRHGTVSLLAGIDLLTGKVHALVRDRHRSREFIEFLKLLDAAYPAGTRDPPDPRQSFR